MFEVRIFERFWDVSFVFNRIENKFQVRISCLNSRNVWQCLTLVDTARKDLNSLSSQTRVTPWISCWSLLCWLGSSLSVSKCFRSIGLIQKMTHFSSVWTLWPVFVQALTASACRGRLRRRRGPSPRSQVPSGPTTTAPSTLPLNT